MDERLAAMQQQIDATKAQNKLLAVRLRQVAQAYRSSAAMGGGGRSMMSGGMPSFGGGGGGMPSFGGAGGGIPGLNALNSLSSLPSQAVSAMSGAGGGEPGHAPLGGGPLLTRSSTAREVAARIIAEAHRRGYNREQIIAILSTGIQESGLNPKASGGGGAWHGIFQQDTSYPGRDDPNRNIDEFLRRLDAKRNSAGASSDMFRNIFWLQQRPGEPSADQALANGRVNYLHEIRSQLRPATRMYEELTA
ncbi:hypothetical protein [Mycobacterium sp. 48b]|uniref:hypothetical protein n=1 Tax=Mycobacterium sp. 48b TaxID=3400426 RepID=UPI003AAD690C